MSLYSKSLIFFFLVNCSLCVRGVDKLSFLKEVDGQSYDLKSIDSASFMPLNEVVYEGFENGVYWFRLVLSSDEGSRVIRIKYAHTVDVKVYHKEEILKRQSHTRFPTFVLLPDNIENTYYIRVNCAKEGYIPLELIAYQDYHKNELAAVLSIGFYYGLVLAVIIFHLFHYFNSKKKTYLYYIFMLFSLSLTIGYRDGFTYFLFGPSWLHQHIEPLFNLCVATSIALFSTEYLQLKDYYPRIVKYRLMFIFLPLTFYAFYLFNDSYWLFVVTENIIIAIISFFVFVGIPIFKKDIYAKFFIIAYVPLLLLSYDFYNSTFFGYHFIGLTTEGFRIGGVLEMMVFTFAITYQAKTLNKENKTLRDNLALRNKELTTFTLKMIEKSEYLKDIEVKLQETLESRPEDRDFRIRKTRDFVKNVIENEGTWDEFRLRFESVNDKFYDKLNSIAPDLSKAETKLAALMKLKLSSKEAASLLNITERSVVSARSRLRKKLNIPSGQSIDDFLSKF